MQLSKRQAVLLGYGANMIGGMLVFFLGLEVFQHQGNLGIFVQFFQESRVIQSSQAGSDFIEVRGSCSLAAFFNLA